MVEEDSLESHSFFVLRLINFTRIVLYGIATWIQLSLFIICKMSSGTCDVMTVLIPLFLLFADMMIIRWSRKPFSDFLTVSILVSIMSNVAAMNTLRPSIYRSIFLNSDEFLMFVLSWGVLLVSFIELMMLIYLIHPR